MNKIFVAALMSLAVDQVHAGRIWNIMQFQIKLGKVAAALKASDDLQSSEAASSYVPKTHGNVF